MISLAGRDILHGWGKFTLTGLGLGLLIGVTLSSLTTAAPTSGSCSRRPLVPTPNPQASTMTRGGVWQECPA